MESGGQTQVTFSQQADLSIVGVHELKIWNTTNPDENVYNDTIVSSVTVVDEVTISNFPSTENFQSFSNCATAGDCEAINCQLTGGWINLENFINDDIDWRTDSGGTGTDDTGPSSDYDLGTLNGKYLYLEGSGSCYNREAILQSPCIDLSNETCAELTFAYHMYGESMGELHVDLITTEGILKDVIPPFVGAQGNQWNLATVDLSPYGGEIINARFRGITGDSYFTDMAIDAISIETYPEPIADFSFTSNGDEFTFTNNSSGNIASYFWDFGDGNTSTETDPTHLYLTTGVFDVTLIIDGSCGQDTITLSIGSTDVENIDYSAAITIHPNPNNGNFIISLPKQLLKNNLNIKLIDVVGKTVLELDNKNYQSSFSVDASTIVNGVYFVKIAGRNFNITKRIIKQ